MTVCVGDLKCEVVGAVGPTGCINGESASCEVEGTFPVFIASVVAACCVVKD